MEHEGIQPRLATDELRHGDGQESQQRGIGRSVSPGALCPETVLVAVMSDGSYVLVGYPRGEPTALVIWDDAGPLRRALLAAFGNPATEAASGNDSSNGTLPCEHDTLHLKQVQR